MTAEGRIEIDLYRRVPHGHCVRIESSRPLSITRQFSGHSPSEIAQTVSLLFATCKAAQSAAAATALEEARGIVVPDSTRRVREMRVLAENAREHTLRILMDWSQFLDAPQPPPAAELRAVMQTERDLARHLDEGREALRFGGTFAYEKDGVEKDIAASEALLECAIFGEPLRIWHARKTKADLINWASHRHTIAQRLFDQLATEGFLDAGAASVSPLPVFDRDCLAARLFDEGSAKFVAAPDWEGVPRETSPLARSLAHPLIRALETEDGFGLGARLAACLVEVARVPGRLRDAVATLDAPEPATPERSEMAPVIGLSQIEAARGRLVHAVELSGGKVSRYRILAPTEWNFHPNGAAARGLARIAHGPAQDVARIARLFVTAVDPCVGYEVRVH
ncbi:nickel-dependent hydrogenase large subunit [Rhodomicrobium sp. Az07]|uniref:nickel-dependent hydrogenase large subunit n=1 Tax=Rhodomicrobium sp. Az07 TaxID=2839034 RepID=UPI001BECC157|nr:nickel-dependent hydrogenase large subunit [Rhodomicrobium sp. Az07]MBT3072062.1 nickel-dependent hydrogenase large subunit [Rhodomicrobium sp. Az07]